MPRTENFGRRFESTSDASCQTWQLLLSDYRFFTATAWDAVVPWDETSASESALVLRWALRSALESLSG